MEPSLARVVRGTSTFFLALFAACAGPPQREGVTPAQAHMFAHFDRAAEVHHAIVRGDLDRARGAAAWIAAHREPAGSALAHPEYLSEMSGHARTVSQTTLLDEAARAAAQMGRTCGDCHAASQVTPRFLIGTAPPGGSGPQAEMARHVWASERMWEGLVGPGDHAWRSGAEALKSGWLDAGQVVSDPADRTAIRDLVRQVYDLGAQAEGATDSEARASLYGEFLNTCADCHRLTAARIR